MKEMMMLDGNELARAQEKILKQAMVNEGYEVFPEEREKHMSKRQLSWALERSGFPTTLRFLEIRSAAG